MHTDKKKLLSFLPPREGCILCLRFYGTKFCINGEGIIAWFLCNENKNTLCPPCFYYDFGIFLSPKESSYAGFQQDPEGWGRMGTLGERVRIQLMSEMRGARPG